MPDAYHLQSGVHPQRPPLTWETCHPDTRALLIDALVWDLVDEAGPNANEPGLAALEHLAEAPSPTGPAAADEHLRALHHQLLLPIDPEALSERAINNDDTTLGLAFAALKLLGRCPKDLLTQALHAIDGQNDPAMLAVRAPEEPDRFVAQRAALRTILECAAIEHTDPDG